MRLIYFTTEVVLDGFDSSQYSKIRCIHNGTEKNPWPIKKPQSNQPLYYTLHLASPKMRYVPFIIRHLL